MITDILLIINVYFKYNDGKMDEVLFMMNETLPKTLGREDRFGAKSLGRG